MPGKDQYVQMPDNTYVHIPGNATPDQLSQFRTKLSGMQKQQDPLVTGAGMEEKAQRQAYGSRTSPAKMQPNYSALMLSNSPTGADPHNAGNPNLNAVPESERAGVNSRAMSTALATTPLMGPLGRATESGLPAVLKMGRGLIGGTVGGMAGESLGHGVGERVGGYFGPEGKKVGGYAGSAMGGLGGMLVGGGLAAGLERDPVTMKMKTLPFNIQKAIPESMVPGGISDKDRALSTFMSKGYKPTSEIERVSSARAPLPDVMHAPVTSEESWLQDPEGNIQNVPRKELPKMIKRTGDPAAVKEARRLGSTVLYVPEEGRPPREKMRFEDDKKQ